MILYPTCSLINNRYGFSATPRTTLCRRSARTGPAARRSRPLGHTHHHQFLHCIHSTGVLHFSRVCNARGLVVLGPAVVVHRRIPYVLPPTEELPRSFRCALVKVVDGQAELGYGSAFPSDAAGVAETVWGLCSDGYAVVFGPCGRERSDEV
jgi:hypothetical protein